MSADGSTKAVVAALVANGGIATAKFVGFAITGASSMLSEAIHSVADTGNQALLLLGGKRARREQDQEHPFGYGRERYFWSFVVAVVLFTLGSLFAIYEGIHKIRHPEEVTSVGVAFVILGLAIVLEIFSFRTAIREASKVRGDSSWWKFLRTSKVPELPVVLLEDAGALVGLVAATAAISVSTITDNPVWDGIGSIFIGVVLGVIAVFLCVEMKSLLIGEGVSADARERLHTAVEADSTVVRVIHDRTQYLGPEEVLVGLKVEFAPGLDVAAMAGAVDALEARVREAVPEVGPMYVEPDLYRPELHGSPRTDPQVDADRGGSSNA